MRMIPIYEIDRYGGAYDIDPDMYFTKDDVLELADEVVDIIAKRYDILLDVSGMNMTSNNNLYLSFSTQNGYEFDTTINIDMRRIRRPRDLSYKYASVVADNIIKQMKDFEVI